MFVCIHHTPAPLASMPRGRPPGSKNKKTLEYEAAVSKIPLPVDDDAPLGSFIKELNKTAETTAKKRKAESAQLSSPPAKRGRSPKAPTGGAPKPRGRPKEKKLNKTAETTAKKRKAESAQLSSPPAKRGRGLRAAVLLTVLKAAHPRAWAVNAWDHHRAEALAAPRGRPKASSAPKAMPSKKTAGTPTQKKGRGRKMPNSARIKRTSQMPQRSGKKSRGSKSNKSNRL